jgi:methylenetetrahydrofolate reductase (NADPH)
MDLDYFSLEATGKTIADLTSAASIIPARTAVNVAWLNDEDDYDRLRTVRRIDDAGLLPVPIFAARRLQSKKHLFDLTEKLRFAGTQEQVMVVGGDPSDASGPFNNTMDLLRTEWLEKYAIKRVTLPGFPEGNAATGYRSDIALLEQKVKLLESYGCSVSITTQLAFDPSRTLNWISQLRNAGVSQTIQIGLPGPTKKDRLLRFARSFGVSAGGLNNVSDTVDGIVDFSRLVRLIEQGLQRRNLKDVAIHLYPFGGTKAAVEWLTEIKARQPQDTSSKLLA